MPSKYMPNTTFANIGDVLAVVDGMGNVEARPPTGAQICKWRGEYSGDVVYMKNDGVSYTPDGSSWIVLKDNIKGILPNSDPQSYALLSARGAVGPAGAKGDVGAQGLKGDSGKDGVGINTITAKANTTDPYAVDITFNKTDTTSQTITTPNLRGVKGDKGDVGLTGVGFTTVTAKANTTDAYAVDITFGKTDSTSQTVTTPNLRGQAGKDGTVGKDGVGINTIISQANTYDPYAIDIIFNKTDGVNQTVTTPNLRGAQGIQGNAGKDGAITSDAPADSKQYARKNNAWAEVTGGGTGTVKTVNSVAPDGSGDVRVGSLNYMGTLIPSDDVFANKLALSDNSNIDTIKTSAGNWWGLKTRAYVGAPTGWNENTRTFHWILDVKVASLDFTNSANCSTIQTITRTDTGEAMTRVCDPSGSYTAWKSAGGGSGDATSLGGVQAKYYNHLNASMLAHNTDINTIKYNETDYLAKTRWYQNIPTYFQGVKDSNLKEDCVLQTTYWWNDRVMIWQQIITGLTTGYQFSRSQGMYDANVSDWVLYTGGWQFVNGNTLTDDEFWSTSPHISFTADKVLPAMTKQYFSTYYFYGFGSNGGTPLNITIQNAITMDSAMNNLCFRFQALGVTVDAQKITINNSNAKPAPLYINHDVMGAWAKVTISNLDYDCAGFLGKVNLSTGNLAINERISNGSVSLATTNDSNTQVSFAKSTNSRVAYTFDSDGGTCNMYNIVVNDSTFNGSDGGSFSLCTFSGDYFHSTGTLAKMDGTIALSNTVGELFCETVLGGTLTFNTLPPEIYFSETYKMHVVIGFTGKSINIYGNHTDMTYDGGGQAMANTVFFRGVLNNPALINLEGDSVEVEELVIKKDIEYVISGSPAGRLKINDINIQCKTLSIGGWAVVSMYNGQLYFTDNNKFAVNQAPFILAYTAILELYNIKAYAEKGSFIISANNSNPASQQVKPYLTYSNMPLTDPAAIKIDTTKSYISIVDSTMAKLGGM